MEAPHDDRGVRLTIVTKESGEHVLRVAHWHDGGWVELLNWRTADSGTVRQEVLEVAEAAIRAWYDSGASSLIYLQSRLQ